MGSLQIWGKWGKNPSPQKHLHSRRSGWRGLGWDLSANPRGTPSSWSCGGGAMTQWGYERQRRQPHIWKGLSREGRINPSHPTLLSLPSR